MVKWSRLLMAGVVWLWPSLWPLAAQSTYYVSVNGSHTSPFTSWATAATNIGEAVALAGANDTVWISNGLHTVTGGVTIAAGFAVRGFTGNAADVVVRRAVEWPPYNTFYLNHAAAWLDSVTATGRYADGGNIYLGDGTVSNCVMTKGEGAWSSSHGGGATVTAGLLIDSVVDQCSSSHGGGIKQTGGTVERCVIRRSTVTYEGAVRIAGGVMRNCTIVSNASGNSSGGFYLEGGGRMENCLVYGNSGAVGGGTVVGGRLLHATVARNTCGSAATIGGVRQTGGAITNSIMWSNLKGAAAGDYSGAGGAIGYSCAYGLTLTNGNIADDPQFVNAATGNYRLAIGSLCCDSGTNLTSVTNDIAGSTRSLDGNGDSVAVADMGAYESATMAPGTLAVAISSPSARSGLAPLAVTLLAVPSGDNTNITWYGWDLNSDGTWDASGAGLGTLATNLPVGCYTVTLRVTNAAAVGAQAVLTNLFTAAGVNIYVSTGGGNQSPYATWGTAATSLESGFGVAVAGCTVNVGAGQYQISNTIALSFPVTLRGVSGNPRDVVVVKNVDWPPFTHFSVSHSSALLTALTVTNRYADGAVAISAGTVSNCVVTKAEGAYSSSVGGGVVMTGGLLTDSLIEKCTTGNGGGGAIYLNGGTAERCVFRGNGSVYAVRVDAGVLRRCRIVTNACADSGGFKLNGGRIENCLVARNTASSGGAAGGGIVAGGALLNCTVVSNAATTTGIGGIARTGGAITNCIVYGNSGSVSNNYSGAGSAVWYSCATELADGVQGNKNGDPLFTAAASGDFTLGEGSPCVNSGANLFWTATDLDLAGSLRLQANTVDMGCYEAPAPPTGTLFKLL